jgi:hypothetical protein
MAIDQYGHAYHDLGERPRKELLKRFGRKHASKMFIDDKDGKSYHTGYVIAGLWLSLYKVEPVRVPL